MSTSPADLRHLPSHLDVAALMRRVLAGKPQEHEIDNALRRVLQQEYPEAEQALFGLIVEMLSAEQRMLGITRQQAATQLAQAKSEMRLSPEGKPEIMSFRVQTEGLDLLSSEQREHVLQELDKAVRTGQPMPKQVLMMPEGNGQRSSWLVLAALAIVAALAAIYSLGYVFGRG
jgi:hypothetical protein